MGKGEKGLLLAALPRWDMSLAEALCPERGKKWLANLSLTEPSFFASSSLNSMQKLSVCLQGFYF